VPFGLRNRYLAGVGPDHTVGVPDPVPANRAFEINTRRQGGAQIATGRPFAKTHSTRWGIAREGDS
jgi:hypothetical protein